MFFRLVSWSAETENSGIPGSARAFEANSRTAYRSSPDKVSDHLSTKQVSGFPLSLGSICAVSVASGYPALATQICPS
jgi:hypothetical protein